MARLSISFLGPLHVTLNGEPVTDFATDKARALLAYLAVEADRSHRRDSLADLLWPEQPQHKARQNLRQALSNLRQAIGDRGDAEPFLLISRETVQFNPDCDHWLDVATFAALVAKCRAHHHRRLETCLPCIRRLERIVDLYRGEFLAHFFLSDSGTFEEWALLKREWFHREAVEALYHLTNACEWRGEYEQARQYARRQVTLEPWREEAHRQLMRVLALEGQRSTALAQYETCRQTLASELGIEPTAETTTLYEQIQAGEGLCSPAPVHGLPSPPTPFVGRDEELAELAELLVNPDCRLVTLVGPGGIGKTRLALQAAADQVGAYCHGVTFVPLAAIGSAEHLATGIADAIRILPHSDQDPREQLLNYLRGREMLLVLDNMEHILNGSTLLSEILAHAPDVVLLVTSRERLHLQEEWTYELRGLRFPKNGALKETASYDAVDLFQQCARRADRHFALEAELPHVVRVCQLVEGMPLGIEMAAAWVAVRPCPEIAREIEHNLDILTTRLRNVPERHRSIRAAFEHSWQLLTQEERLLFARLSVFRGGFCREAATAVTGVSLAILSALLDKSLIHRVPPDRYSMHELVRQYAAEKLEADEQENETTQAQHAHYFAAFLAQQTPHLTGENPAQALLAIAPEIENARQAWHVAVSRGWVHEVEHSLPSLYHFFDVRCRFQEGIDLFGQVIDQWSEDPAQAPVIGKALARQGALYRRLGLYQQARTCLEQGLATLKHLEMPDQQAFCLINLAYVDHHQGHHEQAEQLLQESLALSIQIDDQCGMARSLFLLGRVRHRTGDLGRAEATFEESLAFSRTCGNPRLTMAALNGLGDVICHRGDYARAQAVFEECLTLSRALDDQYNVAIHLNNLGTVHHVLGKYAQAQPYYEESLDICCKIADLPGQAIALSNLGEVAHVLGAYREALAHYQEALAIGRSIEDQWTIMACLNNLGETACILEDHAGARAYFAQALQIAAETQTLAVLLKVLVNLAVLLAGQGQEERAAALLGLALRHPASEQATQEKAQRLLGKMNLAAPEAVPGSLDAVVAELLAELSNG